MQNLLTTIVMALDFFPGYKTKAGAVVLVGVAVASAYNTFLAPQFGLPAVPADWVADASLVGNAVLGVGVANKLAAK